MTDAPRRRTSLLPAPCSAATHSPGARFRRQQHVCVRRPGVRSDAGFVHGLCVQLELRGRQWRRFRPGMLGGGQERKQLAMYKAHQLL